ncbi:MAG TPA: DNA primase [Candidatus Pacearchaeota archaeon]|nr:DNA primase [Candidatus Pacearchaeota archaeon]HOC53851.1 DNA primase [Candidatus Pacearchaeota archaeon]HQM24705.1 DNA primase [Candidatus Pacearchaeota archaeon]
MSQELEEIKSRLNIVDVISSYIKLEKAGVNYRARCPFHEEKSPSFFVSPSRQIWHCFGGCNEGGDIFKFVMKIEGIEFYDALKILADRAGVELKQNKEWKEAKTQRQILLDLNEKACLFFEYQLEKSKKGLEAKEYLFKRGLKEETIKNWRLGYAPDTWQGLTDFLISRGFKREDIIKTGLTIEKDKKSFDRFRSRIIFPITSFNSEVIGFTGRIFGKDDKSEAKYLNSPASILYDKSKALYGIDKAKIEIRKKDSCILVEGNVDCIMSHQAGIDNCIAVSGTALTNLHLGIIKRYSKNLVLAFDMDSAGNKATEKAIEMAGEFNVKVIPRIKDKDPADIILNEGEDFWKKIVQESQPVSEFFFNIALMNKNTSLIEDKKKILKEFLPRVKNMESSVEQSYWIERLVNELKIKEEDIRTELKKIGLKKQELSKNQECLADKKTRRQMIEEKILALVLRQRSRIETIKDFSLFSSPIKEILEKVKEKQDIAFEELQEQFKDDNNFLNYIFLKSEVIEEVEEEEELRTCILEIESLILKEKQIGLHLEIKNLEKKGDFNKVKELLEQFKTLIKYEEKNKKEESCIKEEDSQEKETSQEEISKEESLEKEEDPEEETSQEN